MTVTVRGATYAAALAADGTLALPTGTVAGDVLLLALFAVNATGDYPLPDASYLNGYHPEADPGVWQFLTGFSSAVSAGDYFIRQATSADITAGTITIGDATTAAALIAVTGDHLMIMPSDWNWTSSTLGPVYFDSSDGLFSGPVSLTYGGFTTTTAIYVAILTELDATAAISDGTALLSSPSTQQIVAAYDAIDAVAPVTVSLTTAISYISSGSAYHDAVLSAFLVREIGDGTGAAADDFADATPITLAVDGGTYISPVFSNRGYTIETDEPFVDSPDGRSAWWKYTPAAAGSLTVDTELSPGGGDTVLFLCTGSSVDALTVVAFDDEGGDLGGTSKIIADVDTGVTYYIKVGAYDPTADLLYCLRLTGPASGAVGDTLTVDCPPIDVTAAALGYEPLPAPDNFADAKTIHIATDDATVTSAGYDNIDYSTETGEPHAATSPFLRRTAWWTYTPLHAGTVTFTTDGSTPADGGGIDLELRVYTGSTLAGLVEAAAAGFSADDEDDIARVSFYGYAGHTYHVQLGDGTGLYGSTTVVLTAQGPATDGDPTMAVDAAVIQSAVTVLPAAPVRLSVANPSPADGTVLPVVRPTFTLTVSRGEPEPVTVTVVVTIATAGGATTVATLTQSVTLAYINNTVSLTAPADLTPGTVYYWDAHVSYGGLTLYTMSFKQFTVLGGGAGATTVPVTWTVAAGTPSGHLWFVRPAVGKPGDQITAVGHGATTGTVTVNGTAATGVTFTQISATAATTGRVINPYTGAVDAEHFQAVFTVPAVAAPGGPVVITS